uniref:neural cell adhesion molecule 1-like n=1 Tax=Myxine glutinosa TaxID=7769 RepID=UPI00358FF026
MAASALIILFMMLSAGLALQVEISPSRGEISVGDSKFFVCIVDEEVAEVIWLSPTGKPVELSGRLVASTQGLETMLTIYEAALKDSGIYKCVAKAADGTTTESSVQVDIYQKLTFTDEQHKQEFTEGEVAVVKCVVSGIPRPRVVWKLGRRNVVSKTDERFLLLSNNFLQISNVQKSDEGVYRCEGRITSRGELGFIDIRVVVNVPPTINALEAKVNATAGRGETERLSCVADGSPGPVVTWYHRAAIDEESQLERSAKFSFERRHTVLVVHNITKDDSGLYVCSASNKAGDAEAEVTLHVFVPPEVTFVENPSAAEGDDSVQLTCEAEGEPMPKISWRRLSDGMIFRHGEQDPEGRAVVTSNAELSSLTLRDVQYTDGGKYECVASNTVGNTAAAMFLNVTYAPKFEGNIVTFYSWLGNAVNMSCHVLANPSPLLGWSRDGLSLPSANLSSVIIHHAEGLTMLEITPESQADFGSYSCEATNVMGNENKELLLVQAVSPSAPSVSNVRPYSTSAEVKLDEPEANGGVPVLEFIVRIRPADERGSGSRREWQRFTTNGQQESVQVTGLKPERRYDVQAAARNGAGTGEFSTAVQFETLPIRKPWPSGHNLIHLIPSQSLSQPWPSGP